MRMYLTRDFCGDITLWQEKPEKYEEDGHWKGNDYKWAHIFWADHAPEFSSVKWEDEEPTVVELKIVEKGGEV